MTNFATNIISMILAGMIFLPLNVSANTFETWYTSTALNCRNAPQITSDNIITTYPKGTELQIIGIDDTGKWWQVYDGQIQGWCYSTYFVQSKDELNQPK